MEIIKSKNIPNTWNVKLDRKIVGFIIHDVSAMTYTYFPKGGNRMNAGQPYLSLVARTKSLGDGD
jgi:hypothetical protein